jgi:uncharacterized membrane protein
MLIVAVAGIFGAVYHNNLLLIFMIVGVAAFLFLNIFFRRASLVKIFPIFILITSVGLLFFAVFTSKYIFGSDAFIEFFVYRLTEVKGYWAPPGEAVFYSMIDNVNSMLSITILPTIYSGVIGVDGEVVFKFLYPFIFSLIPLALYKICVTQVNPKIALLASFFFMATPITFYGGEPLSLNRQILGQFFFIISMFLILENSLHIGKKRILLIAFVAALVVSHYSLAYIFLFYVVSLFIFSEIGHRYWRKDSGNLRKILTPIMLLLISALTFSWYINVIQRIASLFTQDFFNPQAGALSEGALTSLSPSVGPSSIVGGIHRIVIYADLLLIVIGLLLLLLRSKRFTVNIEFRLMTFISIIIMGLCFAVPNFANSLNTSRFYSIVLPFLAPFFGLGAVELFYLIRKFITARFLPRWGKPRLSDIGVYFATILLILTFLFQVGLVNYATQDYPYSYTLDLDRKLNSNNTDVLVSVHTFFFNDEEVLGAKWIQEVRNPSSMVYADLNSRARVLKSYALIADNMLIPFTNETLPSNSLVYLKYLNIKLGLFEPGNMSDVVPLLQVCNQIYSNGDSIVFSKPY